MTRFLSQALQATEPAFRLQLRHLEDRHGRPNHDIRLTADIRHRAVNKMRELGLDPKDTTPDELYHALKIRIQQDDERLVKRLRTRAALYVNAEGDVVDGLIHALAALPESKRCFALKQSVFKSLLRKNVPRRTMKRLGYRSVESFLKSETPSGIMTAAMFVEDSRWHQKITDQYKKLKPSDFETRQIRIEKAQYKRWHDIADVVVARRRHNVLGFKELGSVVILPFPKTGAPEGAVTASLSVALHQLNEIREAGAFIKLSQVRPDFGAVVQQVVAGETKLSSSLLEQSVPWGLLQRYFTRSRKHMYESQLAEHIESEDLVWHPVAASLAAIESSFGFWRDTECIGILSESKAVSMNVVDAALNLCNKLAFADRFAGYFRHELHTELLMRYLHPAAVEEAILHELQPAYALGYAAD